jgi:hypothetical protein
LHAGGRDRVRREFRHVDPLRGQLQLGRLERARKEDVLDHPGEPVGLLRDEGEQLPRDVVSEVDVVAEQRLRCAVHRGERRPELVRDGRDEIRLQLLQATFLGEVVERVHGAFGEADGSDREPELAPAEVDRDSRRPRARRDRLPHGAKRVRDGGPRRDRLVERPTYHGVALQSGDRLGGRIPELHDPRVVDEDDAICDRADDARGLCLLARLAIEPVALLS